MDDYNILIDRGVERLRGSNATLRPELDHASVGNRGRYLFLLSCRIQRKGVFHERKAKSKPSTPDG